MTWHLNTVRAELQLLYESVCREESPAFALQPPTEGQTRLLVGATHGKFTCQQQWKRTENRFPPQWQPSHLYSLVLRNVVIRFAVSDERTHNETYLHREATQQKLVTLPWFVFCMRASADSYGCNFLYYGDNAVSGASNTSDNVRITKQECRLTIP